MRKRVFYIFPLLLSYSLNASIVPDSDSVSAEVQTVQAVNDNLEQAEREAQPKQTTPASAPPVSSPRADRLVSRDAVSYPNTDNNNGSMALGKIAISLTLVVLLVLGLGWLFKKLTLRLPGSRQMKVICAMPLGQRERILIIEIQGKQRVIGVTPHSINFLFELENPLPEEKLASDFHTQLQSFLKK